MTSLRATVWAALGSLLCVVAMTGAQGQSAAPNFKEDQVAAAAVSSGDPVPSWVEAVEIPKVIETRPVVERLADAQWLVGDTPIVHIHRAIMINDAASLTSAGQ